MSYKHTDVYYKQSSYSSGTADTIDGTSHTITITESIKTDTGSTVPDHFFKFSQTIVTTIDDSPDPTSYKRHLNRKERRAASARLRSEKKKFRDRKPIRGFR